MGIRVDLGTQLSREDRPHKKIVIPLKIDDLNTLRHDISKGLQNGAVFVFIGITLEPKLELKQIPHHEEVIINTG